MQQHEAAPGTVILGRYRLEARLGAGQSGAVWSAIDAVSGARVAVKLGHAPGEPRRELAAMLRRRWGVVERLDDGVWHGRRVIVMELAEGEIFPGRAAAAEWEALRGPTRSLLTVLGGLHQQGIVHLDLKPEHVRVRADGQITLLDLGLSAGPGVSSAGGWIGEGGSRRYAAPEQLLGRETSPRADLYAVGVMVYEALCGRLPQVHAEEPARSAERVRQAPTPTRQLRPDLPETVAAGLDRMIARFAKDRPANVGEALRVLELDEVGAWRSRLADGNRRHTLNDLERLFAGPSHLLHLPEDAAAELDRRSGGEVELVTRELGSWVQSGIARDNGERLVVDRAAIEALRAGAVFHDPDRQVMTLDGDEARMFAEIERGWPELRRIDLTARLGWEIARLDAALDGLEARGAVVTLPSGLLRPQVELYGEASAVEARATNADAVGDARPEIFAWELHRDGRSREAVRTLGRALRRARGERDTDAELRALAALAGISIAVGTPASLGEARYEVLRSLGQSGAHAVIGRLVQAAELTQQGELTRARQMVAAMADDLPADSPVGATLAPWRLAVFLRATQGQDDANTLVEAQMWARTLNNTAALAQVDAWEAQRAYRRGDYEGAARRHEAAAAGRDSVSGKLASWTGAASSWLEAGDLDRCQAWAERALEVARTHRLAHHEARAWWLRRQAQARRGEGAPAMWELVEAAEQLGDPTMSGLIMLTEAALCLRWGDWRGCEDLARRGETAFKQGRQAAGARLCGALAGCLAEGPEAIRARLDGYRVPTLCDIDWQARALLWSRLPEASPERARLEEELSRIDRPEARRELLSPQEALKIVRGTITIEALSAIGG